MKILWVTNVVIGSMYKEMHGKASNGVWMDALLKDFVSYGEHELVVATTGRNSSTIYLEDGKVKYYLLPGGYPFEYNHKKRKCIDEWKDLISKEKPDIIHIWGSEFTHGLASIKAAPNVPSVVYIQGILDTIARYYEAGIEHKDLIKSITFRDILKRDSILAQKSNYHIRSMHEKEMFELSGNIISENLWCNLHCKAIAPNIETYYCPLSINEIFSKYQWSSELMEPFTIMVNASGYPLKGLHMVLKALNLVKREYPNVRLYVPGRPMISDDNIISKIKKTGYIKYIEKLVYQLEIRDNISFIGSLSAHEMAKKMERVNVFVLGSALENHSSTLKEAMLVGTPCIASIVGGIPEYATHEENALLYRFEEYELLAENIIRIFKNVKLAQKISYNAKNSLVHLHGSDQIYKTIILIYKEIIEGSRLIKSN